MLITRGDKTHSCNTYFMVISIHFCICYRELNVVDSSMAILVTTTSVKI